MQKSAHTYNESDMDDKIDIVFDRKYLTTLRRQNDRAIATISFQVFFAWAFRFISLPTIGSHTHTHSDNDVSTTSSNTHRNVIVKRRGNTSGYGLIQLQIQQRFITRRLAWNVVAVVWPMVGGPSFDGMGEWQWPLSSRMYMKQYTILAPFIPSCEMEFSLCENIFLNENYSIHELLNVRSLGEKWCACI